MLIALKMLAQAYKIYQNNQDFQKFQSHQDYQNFQNSSRSSNLSKITNLKLSNFLLFKFSKQYRILLETFAVLKSIEFFSKLEFK